MNVSQALEYERQPFIPMFIYGDHGAMESERQKGEEALKVLETEYFTTEGDPSFDFATVRDLADRNRDLCDQIGEARLRNVTPATLSRGLSDADTCAAIGKMQKRTAASVMREIRGDRDALDVVELESGLGGGAGDLEHHQVTCHPAAQQRRLGRSAGDVVGDGQHAHVDAFGLEAFGGQAKVHDVAGEWHADALEHQHERAGIHARLFPWDERRHHGDALGDVGLVRRVFLEGAGAVQDVVGVDFRNGRNIGRGRVAQMEAEGVTFRTKVIVGDKNIPAGINNDATETVSAAQLKKDFDAAASVDGKAAGWGVGYEHAFSKRTTGYAGISRTKYDDFNGKNTAGSNVSFKEVLTDKNESVTGFAVGLRHTF